MDNTPLKTDNEHNALIYLLKTYEFLEEVSFSRLVCKSIKSSYGIPAEYTRHNWSTLRQHADDLENFVKQLKQTNPELFL